MNLIFRKAKADDDLEKIAELLYYTDDYIYPFWFENLEKAKKEFPKLILEDHFFFHYSNLYLAIEEETNSIIGLICIVDKSVNLDYDYEKLKKVNDRYRFTVEHYIKGLIDEVQESKFAYISNVCVNPEFRDLHVGTFLLDNLLQEYKKKKFDEIALDVLAGNPRAIHLYEKMGFKKSSDVFPGFNGTNEEKPDVFSMKRTLP